MDFFLFEIGAFKACLLFIFSSLCPKAGKFYMFVPRWYPSLLPVIMWNCYSELPLPPPLLLFSVRCLSCLLCIWCSISPQFFFRRNCALHMCIFGVSMKGGEFRVFLCHQLNLTLHNHLIITSSVFHRSLSHRNYHFCQDLLNTPSYWELILLYNTAN